MPEQTLQAIEWALNQEGVSKDSPHELVDKTREYFNINSVTYNSFSYDDLKPYLI